MPRLKLVAMITLAAVLLAFSAGAFALYVFPGRSERVRLETRCPLSSHAQQCKDLWASYI